eukprot:8564598-Pyramimonas_sp.AAC.1
MSGPRARRSPQSWVGHTFSHTSFHDSAIVPPTPHPTFGEPSYWIGDLMARKTFLTSWTSMISASLNCRR